MKRNDITALHGKTVADLQQQLAELRTELGKIQVEKKAQKLSNPRRVSTVKDDIARVMTIIKVKEQDK